MFSHLSNNIKYKISVLVSLLLALYLLVIFSCYSSFLQKDYITKATHISSKIADNIELRLKIIENTVSMALQNYEFTLNVSNYRAEFLPAFRSVLNSTTDVNNVFFYNAAEEIYYDTYQKSLFHDYVEASQQKYNPDFGTSQWCLFKPAQNESVSLLYSHAIYTDNTFIGYLVIEANAESFTRMVNNYNNSFTRDAMIMLYSSAEEYLLLYPADANRQVIQVISSAEAGNQRFSDTYICNYPLYTGNLYVQLHISLKSVYGKALFMAFVLFIILVATGILCYVCISRYSAYLSQRLTDLTRQLEELPEKEQGGGTIQ